MIKIRLANKNEVKALQDLNDEIFVDNPKFDPDLDTTWAQSDRGEQYFSELLNNPKDCCLIAEDGGRKMGYVAAAPKEMNYRKSKYVAIENIGVVPDYISKGVGKMLMGECLKWAKLQGFEKVYVNSYVKNTNAINFYKKNEFEEIDISLEKTLV